MFTARTVAAAVLILTAAAALTITAARIAVWAVTGVTW